MAKEQISPEEYSKILKGIDLRTISLNKSKAYYNYELKIPENLSIKIDDSAEYKTRKNNIVDIFQTYKVDARPPKSKSRYVHIEITFVVTLLSEFDFNDDFFEVYKEISLKLNTWPYLREFVNQATSRMNIPPLTIPLFKTD